MNLDNAQVSDFNKDHPEAFELLFSSYYSSLCFFAEKYVTQTDDARDLVSEVFSNLWHKQIALKTHTNIKSFLYYSVRNACIDFIRKQKVLAKRNKELEQYLQNDNLFHNEVLKSEVLQDIYAEIQALPDQYKKAFQLWQCR